MLKKINRVLRLLGLNLVRAKRKAPKSEAQRVKEVVAEFLGKNRPPYTREELESASLKCAANQPQPVTVPLSDYTGDAEWQAVLNPNVAVGYEAKKTVVNLDAAFVPVDIDGPTDAEWETSGGTTPEQNEARFERPRVEQPNSKNDINSPTS